MEIKAIETIYNGYKFRSRLEARWAVFFDALGVKYEYEPEGILEDEPYTLWSENKEIKRYLPDFYLSRFNCYFEVKRSSVRNTTEEKEAISKISYGMHHGKWVGLITFGDPMDNDLTIFCQEYNDSSGGNYEEGVEFNIVDDFIVLQTIHDTRDRTFLDFKHNELPIITEQRTIHPSVVLAKEKARQARFEHGEKP